MPTHSAGRLLFAALVLCSIVLAFGFGCQAGRWTVARRYALFVHDPPGQDQMEVIGEHIIRSAERIREDEYVVLREAIERYQKQAPLEQQAGIDTSLRVMKERRAERASQRPVILHIAEGR